MSKCEEQSFLAQIAKAQDDVDRLVFADWLEDQRQGDPRALVARWVATNRLFLSLWAQVPAAYKAQTASLREYRRMCPEFSLPDPPSLEAVWQSFSPEQWRAVETLHQPTLVLVPPLDFDACGALLSRHPHTSTQHQTYVDALYRTHAQPAPARWRGRSLEGARNNMLQPEPAVLEQTMAECLDAEEHSRPAHVGGIDRYDYAWLQLQHLERTQDSLGQLDTDTWTLLNADNAWLEGNRYRVPGAYFDSAHGQVRFGAGATGERDQIARVRRAVGGDVA